MVRKMLVIMNHELNPDQIEDAKMRFGIEEIVYMPENFQKLWRNISPDLKIVEFDNYFKLFILWTRISINYEDIILIMGECTATMYIIMKLREMGYKNFFATTTKRKVIKEKMENGEVQKLSVFKHVMFRKYP